MGKQCIGDSVILIETGLTVTMLATASISPRLSTTMMIAKEKKWKIELKKKKITLMLALSINWMQMTMIIRRTVPMTMGRTVALKTKRYELRGMRRIVTAMSMKMRIMGKREE